MMLRMPDPRLNARFFASLSYDTNKAKWLPARLMAEQKVNLFGRNKTIRRWNILLSRNRLEHGKRTANRCKPA